MHAGASLRHTLVTWIYAMHIKSCLAKMIEIREAYCRKLLSSDCCGGFEYIIIHI